MLFLLPELKPGVFSYRKNRFAAEIQSGDQPLAIHLANSGRMKELLVPGAKVWWQPKNTPKTAGSLWMVEKDGFLVILTAVTANHLFEAAIKQESFEELKRYRFIRREFQHGKSRFDFLLQNRVTGKMVLTEVKSVNLCVNGTGLFPDAPTLRGTRHLKELTESVNTGYEALVVFVGLRPDLRQFSPHENMDPDFADALRKSEKAGVRILACGSEWREQGCQNLFFVPVRINSSPLRPASDE